MTRDFKVKQRPTYEHSNRTWIDSVGGEFYIHWHNGYTVYFVAEDRQPDDFKDQKFETMEKALKAVQKAHAERVKKALFEFELRWLEF